MCGTSEKAGSWKAGENNAKPGIVMEAHPAVGDAYRQKFLLGTAEDFASVLSLDEKVTGPLGSLTIALRPKRRAVWNPIRWNLSSMRQTLDWSL